MPCAAAGAAGVATYSKIAAATTNANFFIMKIFPL